MIETNPTISVESTWGRRLTGPALEYPSLDLDGQNVFHYGDLARVAVDEYHPERASEFAILVRDKELANKSPKGYERVVRLGSDGVCFDGFQFTAEGLGIHE